MALRSTAFDVEQTESPPAASGLWQGPWHLWPRVLTFALATILVGVGVLAALVVYVAFTLPVPSDEAPPPQPSLLLEAADGRVFATRGAFRGVHVELKDLPPDLINAVLAIEDRRFRDHVGLDLRGIARALLANVTAGRVREGGSTITQQLARLTFLSHERSFERKLQEALLALWLEARLTKDEILTRYLNSAYFGAGAFGVQGASQRYFRKPASDLSLSEAAMLAGLVQAPSLYAPTRNMAAARERAETVLGAMVAVGFIDEARAAAARAMPATLAVDPGTTPGRNYFIDWVADQTRQLMGAVAGEFTVRTTLDLALQAVAEETIERYLETEGPKKGFSQAALVALSHDGAILAMVGGRDYGGSQFNRATQARRQPGSLFKLFVYMAAFNAGLTPDTVMRDQPVRIGDWEPQNITGRYMGPVNLRTAFAQSINTIAVELMQQTGPQPVIDLAAGLGITSPLDPNPSLALGTSGVTLLEITRAYAAVAAARPSVTTYGVETIRGRTDTFYTRPPSPPPVEGVPLPWPQREMLDLLLASVRQGTARAAALTRPSAGKTGTTQDHRDAWYIGFTADAVVGVWVGNDDNTPMRNVTGGDVPALMWRDFMQKADKIKAAGPTSALGN